MDRSLLRFMVAGLVAALFATSVAFPASSAPAPEGDGGCLRSGDDALPPGVMDSPMATASLAVHNAERARLRLPPLAWNCNLEADAAQWAAILAGRGKLEHAGSEARNGSGENLWIGTAGGWPVEHMVGRFVEEGRNYRHGRFPDISRTGKWTDAGHYSQVVWRKTRQVGCALARGAEQDVLVCRYRPAGNVMGQTPY